MTSTSCRRAPGCRAPARDRLPANSSSPQPGTTSPRTGPRPRVRGGDRQAARRVVIDADAAAAALPAAAARRVARPRRAAVRRRALRGDPAGVANLGPRRARPERARSSGCRGTSTRPAQLLAQAGHDAGRLARRGASAGDRRALARAGGRLDDAGARSGAQARSMAVAIAPVAGRPGVAAPTSPSTSGSSAPLGVAGQGAADVAAQLAARTVRMPRLTIRGPDRRTGARGRDRARVRSATGEAYRRGRHV